MPKFKANVDLTVHRDGEEPLLFTAGDECKGTPAGWPAQWLIDAGSVSPMSAPKSKPGPVASGDSEENA